MLHQRWEWRVGWEWDGVGIVVGDGVGMKEA